MGFRPLVFPLYLCLFLYLFLHVAVVEHDELWRQDCGSVEHCVVVYLSVVDENPVQLAWDVAQRYVGVLLD